MHFPLLLSEKEQYKQWTKALPTLGAQGKGAAHLAKAMGAGMECIGQRIGLGEDMGKSTGKPWFYHQIQEPVHFPIVQFYVSGSIH